MDLVRQSFGITAVFILLWLALWWVKRKGSGVGIRVKRSDCKPDLESVDRLVLTAQHSIQLVRVKDEVFVIGLHPSGMCLLKILGRSVTQ